MKDKLILDPCCGSKMFWFDKNRPDTLYCDKRNESHILCDGRALQISPDMQIDFCNMPFKDNSFKLVVFDPPHLNTLGKRSWMALKYGRLEEGWQDEIKNGFNECWRVLDVYGTLIFKWNETDVRLNEVLSLFDEKPLFGHTTGRQSKTIWMTFFKQEKFELKETKIINDPANFIECNTTECCGIGPIVNENYCPNCGRKIVRK